MAIEKYIVREMTKHPSFGVQDLFKLLYQASFGKEHILTDKAEEYLYQEALSVSEGNDSLYDAISPDYIRVNLSAWNREGLDIKWLKSLFFSTLCSRKGSDDVFFSYLSEVEEAIEDGRIQLGLNEYRAYRDEYLSQGLHPVHHSQKYRDCETPHYRLLPSCFGRAIDVLSAINKGTRVIAIDGRAASGKTTLAAILSEVLDCQIVHMDDFFLPMEKRTPERLSEPGGNVDYERFCEEVVPNIERFESFSYGVFDCSEMKISSNANISIKDYLIVEGSYSHHPKFGEYADLYVFSDVDPSIQLDRILKRNGEKMLEAFKTRWIPMEEKYFDAFSIRNSADLVI